MKKWISCILVLVLVAAMPMAQVSANPLVEPLWENANSANVSLSISSTGYATVNVGFMGSYILKSATVTTFLEKRVGSSWVRVELPTPHDAWIDTTTWFDLSKTHGVQLDSKGEYRVTARFIWTGNIVETATLTDYDVY